MLEVCQCVTRGLSPQGKNVKGSTPSELISNMNHTMSHYTILYYIDASVVTLWGERKVATLHH
jgi:hypothetical protein